MMLPASIKYAPPRLAWFAPISVSRVVRRRAEDLSQQYQYELKLGRIDVSFDVGLAMPATAPELGLSLGGT